MCIQLAFERWEDAQEAYLEASRSSTLFGGRQARYKLVPLRDRDSQQTQQQYPQVGGCANVNRVMQRTAKPFLALRMIDKLQVLLEAAGTASTGASFSILNCTCAYQGGG